MSAKRQTKFERDCTAVAERLGIDVIFFYDEPGPVDAHEDDETLHVRKNGVRAAFGVGGDNIPGALQNRRTVDVLDALGMADKITDSVLVEEDDDEEDEPHCDTCTCW